MANWLHRTTLSYLGSTSPNSLPEDISNYIEAPDLSAVVGVAKKYWKVVGDIVSEMTQPEKAVVDAAELLAAQDALEAESLQGIIKAIIAALIKTINIRLPAGQKITAAEVKTAIRGEL